MMSSFDCVAPPGTSQRLSARNNWKTQSRDYSSVWQSFSSCWQSQHWPCDWPRP